MQTDEKTAVIYCRVSTAKQADEELPIQSQQQRCEEKAASLDAVVLKVYIDEGLSGQHDARPAFQQALLFCEAHSPTYFVTWSTSRFARNMLDAQLNKRRLSKSGTSLVYASMEIDRDSQGGWLTERTMELFDEFYSRQIAADTRRSMIKAAQSGYWCGGRTPFGYQSIPASDDPKRKRLEPVPDEVGTVQRAFELKVQGQGAKSIALILNEERRLNRGKPWSKAGILGLLRSQVVLGYIVFGKRIRIEGKQQLSDIKNWMIVPAHQPIISRSLWDNVQALLDADAANTETGVGRYEGSPHSTYLFTGLLRCGQCDGPLQIETSKGRSHRYYYYNCRNARLKDNCTNRRLPARELDEWLFAVISNEVFTPDNLRKVAQSLQELNDSWAVEHHRRCLELEKQIRAVTKRNSRLFDVLEAWGKEAPNLTEITQRMQENTAQLAQLEAELTHTKAEEPPTVFREVEDSLLREWLLIVMLDPTNIKKTRRFLADFIEKITVKGSAVEIDYFQKTMKPITQAGAVHA